MKRNSASLLALVAISAFVGAPETFSADDARRVSIETIQDLKLSGYSQDDGGDLQWQLEADAANIASKDKPEDIKKALWNLKNLRLRTYGTGGKQFALMTSADGKFHPENREAESDSKVEVRGDAFTVRGSSWSWAGRGNDNLIRVRGNVFVSILLPEKKTDDAISESNSSDRRSLKILAKRLTIEGTDTQTTLTFSGDVEVFYDDISATADSLEVVISGRGSRAAELGSSENDSSLDMVRQATGRGNVQLERGSMRIFGDRVEFLPQEEKFFVRGNAKLTDSSSDLSVSGNEAVGKIDEHFVEILAEDPVLADSPKTTIVTVKMPSLIKRKDANPSDRTVINGRRLTVKTIDNTNVVSLFDDVAVVDRDIRIHADKLVVTGEASPNAALLATTNSDEGSSLDKIQSVLAEGNVKADYSGRKLYCHRADVLPLKNRILLTGEPRVISKDENSSLRGDRVEISLDRDLIEVFSEPGNAPERRRVEAVLPHISEIGESAERSAIASEKKPQTIIIGEQLNLTRGSDLSTFDFFGNVELSADTISGSCDRVVVFADSTQSKKDDLSQVKKIIAEGSVELNQGGYELTGGRATITPGIKLKEWTSEDESDADGDAPFLVVVEPDRESGVRPRIIFPNDTDNGVLKFALPTSADAQEATPEPEEASEESADESEDDNEVLPLTKKIADDPEPAKTTEAPDVKKTYLECDAMDLIAGKRRARFFLRGDVILVTEGGAHGMCDTVEGLLLKREVPGGEDGPEKFDAEKVICRGKVRLVHDGSSGRGSVLEIFPKENRAILSGNAHYKDKSGIELRPGNDRFMFDLEKRQMITGILSMPESDVPAQVSRPQIIIPKGRNRIFVIPKSAKRPAEK